MAGQMHHEHVDQLTSTDLHQRAPVLVPMHVTPSTPLAQVRHELTVFARMRKAAGEDPVQPQVVLELPCTFYALNTTRCVHAGAVHRTTKPCALRPVSCALHGFTNRGFLPSPCA